MPTIKFDFMPAQSILADWKAANEEGYELQYSAAYDMGVQVVAFMNAGGSQRAFAKGIGELSNTRTRQAYIITMNPKKVAAYEKKVAEGDRSINGLAEFIDGRKPTTTEFKPTAAQKKVIVAKAAAIKLLLDGVDAKVRKAILAEVK